MRATALLVLALAALPFSCSSDSDSMGALASGCKLTSECDAELVCSFGLCHEECAKSVDCPNKGRCVKASADIHVCVLPQEDVDCTYSSMCASPLVCAVDQRCRNQCTKARDCIEGQLCATTGVCADTNEVDSSGNLIGSHPGEGGAGGSGAETSSAGATTGGASSGGTSSGGQSSGGTGNSSSDAGDAGAGAEPCARPLPGGGCNYCPKDACSNGDCISADGDYSCDCLPGYSGSGTKLCTLADACEADLGCAPAYPCVATEMPGGYACQGEAATWPMPDREAGGAATPKYSGSQGVVLDGITHLRWEAAGHTDCAPSAACDYPAARDYCDALTLGGRSDWRLPTLIELQSLLDCTHTFQPLIDSNAFPITPVARYWTASPVAGGGSNGWGVDFSTCGSYSMGASEQHAARCVAGTGIQPDLPLDHYTVNSSDPETVLDNWTGLTWSRAIDPTPVVLADAQAKCSALGSGFRIPSLKELITLVDPAQLNPAIDGSAFPGVTGGGEVWTSTSGIGSGSGSYYVAFQDGSVKWNTPGARTYAVRCVKP